MKAGLIRSTVQGLVAVAVSLLVVKLPALDSVLNTEVQALVVGLFVPLVVAAQLKVEKRFPAVGNALRSPEYGAAAKEVAKTGLELLATQDAVEHNAVLRQVVLDLLDELNDQDGDEHLAVHEPEVDDEVDVEQQ